VKHANRRWGVLHVAASRELSHFVELARRGSSPAASGGEQRAFRIAEALLQDVAGLDQDALNGLGFFARLCSANLDAARDLIEGRKEGDANV
jgi:hypothetical protein